ncbi:aminopeptidase [Jutongia hominis]|jgi:aspartyl aminopeptidase|uniref:M18 family aminopeptidase n=1 Tax=Jutongia hominis TaxID=2763664 RepID=A0ABR7MU49_9FIRM|nr:aminopeptidase [Jutongia hominis]MBC8557320.1 aminopeptidase [Jutongia hominis]
MRENVWKNYNEKEKEELEKLCADYMQFLSDCKTERECVKDIVQRAKLAGYKSLEEVMEQKKRLKSGDKVYAVCMQKAVALFCIGTEPMEKGLNILGAHIDSPRLDVKQNPLYEDGDMAYLDTHYYGGIKKYQWVTLPLAIHGVVVKKDGSSVQIHIGEKEEDPVFCVSDLLIHLAGEQMEKKAGKVIEGENLDLLVGSIPLESEEKDAVKKGVLAILSKEYGMEEEDFISAELEIVPAGKARELGFDRSMILSYGQDDRVCAFTSLDAMLAVDAPKRTSCCLLVDKEEIGSVGATGMRSRFFENSLAEVMALTGEYQELTLRRALKNSKMLSSDVNAGFDPLYAASFDKKNASYCGSGMVISKYTGSRGKSGSNDANAEYLAQLRNIFDQNHAHYQTAELGKVDAGGGGTIAYIAALYGMNVIDCGVAVLSMHAPWEVTSKADVYEAQKCYVAFLQNA